MEKQRWEESERRSQEVRRAEKIRERVSRKKMQARENCVFFVALKGRKVGSLKRAGAEPSSQMRDAKMHANVTRSTFRSQNVKKELQRQSTFRS